MMKKVFWTIVAVVVAGGALVGVLLLRSDTPVGPSVRIGGGTPILVTVADTPSKREQGLSGMPALPEGQGMLFVFEAPVRPGFWMKDMLFPIDIIWITSDWQVIAVSEQLTPESFPKTYLPAVPVQYVLEVPAGYVEQYGIAIGQSVQFEK